MSDSKMRVQIPTTAKDLLSLAKKVYGKHKTEGATSPLKLLVDYNWDAEGVKIDQAQAKHDEAERYKKQMETAYRERDLLMADTVSIIRASRDLLTGMNRENMKRLSDWGFTVEASTANKSKTATKNKPV